MGNVANVNVSCFHFFWCPVYAGWPESPDPFFKFTSVWNPTLTFEQTGRWAGMLDSVLPYSSHNWPMEKHKYNKFQKIQVVWQCEDHAGLRVLWLGIVVVKASGNLKCWPLILCVIGRQSPEKSHICPVEAWCGDFPPDPLPKYHLYRDSMAGLFFPSSSRATSEDVITGTGTWHLRRDMAIHGDSERVESHRGWGGSGNDFLNGISTVLLIKQWQTVECKMALWNTNGCQKLCVITTSYRTCNIS